MAINFLTSTESTFDVIVTADNSVTCNDDQRRKYLNEGAYTRSELGRVLWVEAPTDLRDKARWHHELPIDEREAYADYEAYISRVYVEMIRESLVSINGEPATVDMIQRIRPDSMRITTITELVLHIQRVSLTGDQGK